jgi:hypothetical protein
VDEVQRLLYGKLKNVEERRSETHFSVSLLYCGVPAAVALDGVFPSVCCLLLSAYRISTYRLPWMRRRRALRARTLGRGFESRFGHGCMCLVYVVSSNVGDELIACSRSPNVCHKTGQEATNKGSQCCIARQGDDDWAEESIIEQWGHGFEFLCVLLLLSWFLLLRIS